ncbi:hypothetical protein SEPCBS119000_002138 [Sporothrix epigloea]|uniref:Uncharacterized protein n=1 Tax=Sporothrix epigloea TaxID=1892477 RepID=A0ABP0DG79_9PEZI
MADDAQVAKEQAAEASRIFDALDFHPNNEDMDEGRMKYFIRIVEDSKLADGHLVSVLIAFEEWDISLFQACSSTTLTMLRELLMRRGIYVADHREVGGSVAQCLFDVINDEQNLEWPERTIATFFSSAFLQSYNRKLQERVGSQRVDPRFRLAAVTSAPSVSTTSFGGMTPSSSAAPSVYGTESNGRSTPTQSNWSGNANRSQYGSGAPLALATEEEKAFFSDYQLIYPKPAMLDSDVPGAMREIRNNFPERMKYTGSSDQMGIVYRTRQFLNFCSDNFLAESWLINILPAMMEHGPVYDYCSEIRHTVTDWRLVIQRVAKRYEGACVVRKRRDLWYNASLAEITRACPEMLLSEAVQDLYDHLAALQRTLPDQESTEANLYSRLLTAFERDVRTRKYAGLVSNAASDSIQLYWKMMTLVESHEMHAGADEYIR